METKLRSADLIPSFKRFQITGLFLYPMKTSENLWSSYIFRGVERKHWDEIGKVTEEWLKPSNPWFINNYLLPTATSNINIQVGLVRAVVRHSWKKYELRVNFPYDIKSNW